MIPLEQTHLPHGEQEFTPSSADKQYSNFGKAWYRFTRNPTAVIGLVIVVSVVLFALLAPLLAPYPEHAGSFVNFRARHHAPDWDYWMGTDNVGRDILTRVLYGYRVSLSLVVGVLALSVPVGVLLGIVAAYAGGWIEQLIMRFNDMLLAVPPLALALAITSILEPNLTNAMLAIACLWWNWHCRLVYRLAKSIVTEDFIEAARLSGASHWHIVVKEILPNCVAAISVKTTLDAGFVILFGATLSFLGLGVQPPTPDLGTMVSTGAAYLPEYWWEAMMPGLAILYAILGFNLLGDGLRDFFDVEV
ncbi:peptide/nickel transport system permease protein [Vibrio xiamenensis]|uniref:Peptide/nickel transport system permease protein n=1 Tax=Vibrio xiamenensis TaxID=861298 RepID=A0A1G7WWD5_9VIBR|nr:ABC transporter permease [Vibrio xiamenensis]SDG76253.1 peptide/nickel transport system permease protein [Vibrio xiamenensis]SDG87518.1 peptide/nickel transport system permease protein [Vibrio xiamenensis]